MDDRIGSMHVSSALYEKAFDFEITSEVATEVMVAAVPRSGSTAFCLELWRTGVLGAPLEYANFRLIGRQPRWASELDDILSYWRKIKSVRTCPNGIFSYKFFVTNYSGISKREPRLLSLIAPTYVIYLTRSDLLSQAISYSKAGRSGEWFAGGRADGGAGLTLDIAHVRECYLHLRRQMASWEKVFALTDAKILRLTYESFLESPLATARLAVRHVLGDDSSLAPIDIPQIGVQRNSHTEAWRSELYELERSWRAIPI